jgi:hypothetical protein
VRQLNEADTGLMLETPTCAQNENVTNLQGAQREQTLAFRIVESSIRASKASAELKMATKARTPTVMNLPIFRWPLFKNVDLNSVPSIGVSCNFIHLKRCELLTVEA